MIIYKDIAVNHIQDYIRTSCNLSKKNSMLSVITGGTDSFVLAALLLKSTAIIPVVLIFMGFKQENEDIFEKWVIDNFDKSRYQIIKPKHPTFEDENLKNVDIRSSLIPAYVDLYAKINNSITFGNITKSEYDMVKFYKTRIDDCYDNFPLIDLYKSEIKELAEFINLPAGIKSTKSLLEESFGFSYEDLEWLSRENSNTSLVNSEVFPYNSPHWAIFDNKIKLLLTKVFQLNKGNKQRLIPDDKKFLIRSYIKGIVS